MRKRGSTLIRNKRISLGLLTSAIIAAWSPAGWAADPFVVRDIRVEGLQRDRARQAVRKFNRWMADQLGTDRMARLLEDLQQLNAHLVQYPTEELIPEVGPRSNPDSNAA